MSKYCLVPLSWFSPWKCLVFMWGANLIIIFYDMRFTYLKYWDYVYRLMTLVYLPGLLWLLIVWNVFYYVIITLYIFSILNVIDYYEAQVTSLKQDLDLAQSGITTDGSHDNTSRTANNAINSDTTTGNYKALIKVTIATSNYKALIKVTIATSNYKALIKVTIATDNYKAIIKVAIATSNCNALIKVTIQQTCCKALIKVTIATNNYKSLINVTLGTGNYNDLMEVIKALNVALTTDNCMAHIKVTMATGYYKGP